MVPPPWSRHLVHRKYIAVTTGVIVRGLWTWKRFPKKQIHLILNLVGCRIVIFRQPGTYDDS